MIVKKIFPVSDMMCAACASSVTSVLEQIEGVKEVNVNYASQKATIKYDTRIISAEKLKQYVVEAGYDLEIDYVSPEELEQRANQRYQRLKRDLVGSLFCSIPIFVIAMFHVHFPYHEYVQGLLATISLIYFGKRFFIGAWKQLIHRTANMDTLIAMSTGVAFLYSWSNVFFEEFWRNRGIEPHLYFEAVVVIISFILLGKVLEERAKGQTSKAIKKLIGLAPKTALVKRENIWKEISIDEVEVEDIILVKPGQKIAVDGIVIKGESYVDESMISGEPLAVKKAINDIVFSGTLNQLGTFEMKAQKVGAQTLLANIIKAVDQAQGSKPPVQKLVDKISSIFVPTIILIAIIAFVIWNVLDIENGFTYGLQAFVTILVIACPCALGLATPTAIMIGIGKGAENGILIKDAESFEFANKINAVVLDKTGTITEGNPTIVDAIWKNKEYYIPILYSLEYYSQHPLAQAVVKHYENIPLKEIQNYETISGEGLQAVIDGENYRVGNIQWLLNWGAALSDEFKEKISDWKSKTSVIGLANQSEIVAIIAISDMIKPTSIDAIRSLQQENIQVYMLTGDDIKTAQSVANIVGIKYVVAGVKPSDKQDFIKKLQSEGKKVAMVGDGINDSQALAQADVSIAMGKGSDIAIDVAQITLISSDLSKIHKAIKLSHNTLKTIRQNLFWAFIYNIIGVPIAAGVLYPLGFLLNPMIAGAAMAFSSVSVVVNSLLLRIKNID